jgi:hypothetical protein
MRIVVVPDQASWVRALAGKPCLLVRNLSQEMHYSPNTWEVLVDGRLLLVHRLDLGSVDEAG